MKVIKKIIKSFLIALILNFIYLTTSSNAINWQMIQLNTYFDVDSIIKYNPLDPYISKNSYSYLIMDTKIGQNVYGNKFGYGIINYIIDCDKKQNAIIATKIFDNKSILLNSALYNENELQWQKIAPYSLGEYSYNYICNSQNYTQNTISKPEITPTDIYNQSVVSTVYIETKNKHNKLIALGSGVIVSSDGSIVTCFHVIADADIIEIKLHDGSIYRVNGFKYINPLDDIAILTIESIRNFKPIKLAKIRNLQIGEKVYSLANPRGYQFTFADGMLNQYSDATIQFSAPISPGSSGGALLNSQGELIGIITSQIAPSKAQNINFAVPNHYFISKIQNIPVINNSNLLWTDFLISNANLEQLKLYAKYSDQHQKYEMLYKSLLPFTKRMDFPQNRYASMGIIAHLAATEANSKGDFLQSEKYNKEAIMWLNKSIDSGYNVETCAYAIGLIAPLIGVDTPKYKEIFLKAMNYLENYKDSYENYYSILSDMEDCNKDLTCIHTVMYNRYEYLNKLQKEEMGEQYYNLNWFYNLKSYNKYSL